MAKWTILRSALRHLQRTAGPADDEYTSYKTEKRDRMKPAANSLSSSESASILVSDELPPAAAATPPTGITRRCTGRVVPVSSLICCIEWKSIMYVRPCVDRLISSSPVW